MVWIINQQVLDSSSDSLTCFHIKLDYQNFIMETTFSGTDNDSGNLSATRSEFPAIEDEEQQEKEERSNLVTGPTDAAVGLTGCALDGCTERGAYRCGKCEAIKYCRCILIP